MKLPRSALSILAFVVLFALPLGLIIASASIQTDTVMSRTQQTNTSTEEPQASSTARPSDKTTQKILLIGNPDAPVTLVEYADFQCPFCAQFFRKTEPQLLANYIDAGKVKIEFRIETHIGEESVLAGEAAYCANDQQSFHEFHDELYRRQSGYNQGAFSTGNLKRIATDLSLDDAAFADCLDSGKHRATVEASNAEARQRGVTQTPTIFIGDQKIAGAQPYAVYEALIDEQL